MKEPNKGTVSKILSTKIIAGYKMATAPSVKAKEQPGLEPICIGDNKYRIKAGSTVLMFHCKETGIKFEMQPETTIEYALDYEEEYIKLIEENGYELLGPIFNVEVISGRVSAVYLPHYVRLEGFRGEKSIKYGHFKDGKVTLQTPTRIENSYVVLENPTFCGVAVVGKPIPSFFKSEKYPFDGRVQIFARVLCPEQIELTEYKIHLYLIPADGHIVKKLNDLKDDKGFQMIEKPSQTSKVYQHKTYTIRGEPEAKIKPTTLEFLVHKDTGVLPFTEITISKNAILRSRTPISLRVGAEGSSVWDGELSRAEIEELTRKANKGDFIHKNRPALIQDVKNIKPVLDDLLKKDLLKKEQYEIVTSRTTPQEQMRSLLSYVESWGREDQSTFYEVLKKHNKSTIKKIENGN